MSGTKISLILVIVCLKTLLYAQKVGVVLSGGGASGFAHIGVLKALEENNIPIDYITGTSAGALVGSMYAVGFSPSEIQEYVLSPKFITMTQGGLEKNQEFFFFENNDDGSIITIPFTKDSIFSKSLPTNFISSTLLDFEMMRILGKASAIYNDEFNKLFIPFRCVASDIVNKKSVVFNKGKLNLAVRASMTYPFFISPIEIDGKLLFDGGLYNNFPIDVMYQDFDVDYIIGSNVTSNASKPTAENLMSQVVNMLMSHTNFELPCENGLIISPKIDLGTFEFSEIKSAIDSGYFATLRQIDSLKIHISRSVSVEELFLKRNQFKSKIKKLNIEKVNTYIKNNDDVRFVRNSILKVNKNQTLSEKKLIKRFFRTVNFEQVSSLMPSLSIKDSLYTLDLLVKKAKDFKLDVGGHFSSRPINTGYIGLSYLYVKKYALKVKAESYFGRFYGSAKVVIDFTIPNYYPVTISPYFVLNRWDYFRSLSTFFEDVKPSFLVQDELYYGLKFKNPIGNTGKSTLDFRVFDLEDKYYQTTNFTSKDTTDVTKFKGLNLSYGIELNTLNRKQFANSGSLFGLKFRYINGREHSVSGSTSESKYSEKKYHNWIQINAEVQDYFWSRNHLHIGIHGKVTMNSQSLFKNYTATLLNTTDFSPFPDLSTFFLAEYRAPQHVGGGLNIVFTILKNIDLRIDSYYYQPLKQLIQFENNEFGYSKLFSGETTLHSISAIYHSPIGPIRSTFNILPKQTQKVYFQLSYGYLIFNERAIR